MPEPIHQPVETLRCFGCAGQPQGPHDDDCYVAEHAAMQAGDRLATPIHDPEECYLCLVQSPPILSECRCGDCCRGLIIEATLEDVAREPQIAARGSPICAPAELTRSGRMELEGYMLNGPSGCVFLDGATNHCTIYETRPLCCRRFDCATYCQADSRGERS